MISGFSFCFWLVFFFKKKKNGGVWGFKGKWGWGRKRGEKGKEKGKIKNTSTRNRLPITFILDVAGSEHALDISIARPRLGQDIILRVRRDLALEHLRRGIVADGVEEAVGLQFLLASVDDVFDPQARHQPAIALFARDFHRDGVVADGHFGVVGEATGHGLAGTQLVFSHEDRDVAAIFGQEDGFFGGGVAASDDDERFGAEDWDGAVADCACGNTVLPVFFFAGEVETAGGGAGGDDEGGGCVGGVWGVFGVEFEGAGGEIDALNRFCDD